MKKCFSVKKTLKIILDIIYWIGVIASIIITPLGIITLIDKPTFMPVLSFKAVIFPCVECIMYTILVYELRKVLDAIIKRNTFILANVRGFRKISIVIIIIGLIDSINGIINNNFGFLFSFNSSTGAMKTDILLYLILAGIVLVIAETIEEHIKNRDENM